uniref:Histone-lysine N-methyltransferase, H3 lysine-79 specific n=1 Tax=Caenorhabditis tropicalis TaxID=1561998 RepID=A0A1I7ULD8_9PELO
MSEADAGAKEEEPSKEEEKPVPAKQLDDRRSMSMDTNDELLALHSVYYNGKALRLQVTSPHIYYIVFRILRKVCNAIPALAVGLPLNWDKIEKPDNNAVVSLTKQYNRVAKPFATNWSGSYNTDVLHEWGEPNCNKLVATEITGYAYECAVPRPADLNHYYKSFTSETYGETNLEQMASIIDELKIGSHDVFVDLGSGIGQLVCFTAALAKCKKCVGIELSPTPANYASNLGDYFKKLMSFFGKNCGKYEHIQGDFLNPKFKKLICEEATIIFINNFAFSPDLMFRITNELLQELKNGTRIITTKPFGAHKKGITYRSTSDINAISQTIELKSMESGVSWTAKEVKFYCTTMDHAKLIRYYEEEQRKKDPNYNPVREESEFLIVMVLFVN